MPFKNLKLINKSEIARKLGISPSYVSRLLRGQRKSKKYKKAIEELISKELGEKAA